MIDWMGSRFREDEILSVHVVKDKGPELGQFQLLLFCGCVCLAVSLFVGSGSEGFWLFLGLGVFGILIGGSGSLLGRRDIRHMVEITAAQNGKKRKVTGVATTKDRAVAEGYEVLRQFESTHHVELFSKKYGMKKL